MSTLIDFYKDTQTEIGGKWWFAKPLADTGIRGFRCRLRDACQVLQGKAIAVHFKEDTRKDK
jgi:hypothetical protein